MNLETIRSAIAEATGSFPNGVPHPVGGGCINETFQLGDYFVKVNGPDCVEMFEAERLGLGAIDRTGTVRVPRPCCAGVDSSGSFLVLEFLPLAGSPRASQEELGRGLAELHRSTAASFGWERDNFIGATPQPNPETASWIEFLREQRLGHMLRLASGRGYTFRHTEQLLDSLSSFFPAGEPAPSLLHGDLWSGNAGALTDATPVIFDPAVYYGDREADLAMTRLFGGFGAGFYGAYEEVSPLPAGHEARVELYNLYHILNHAVLFGGGYARQAQGMIDGLLGRL